MKTTTKINNWLEQNPVFSLWSKTPIGSGSDHGVMDQLPEYIDPDEIEGLEENGNSLEFSIGSTWYVLSPAEWPSDRFGNYANFQEWDLTIVDPSCFEIGWGDDTAIELNFPEDWDSVDHNDVLTEAMSLGLAWSIEETNVCNGFVNSRVFYLSNVPYEDPRWLKVVNSLIDD